MRFGFLTFIIIARLVALIISAGTVCPNAQSVYQSVPPDSHNNSIININDLSPQANIATPQKKEIVYSRHEDVIPSIAFSPDGKRLASAGDNCVKITDRETGKELLNLKNSHGMHYFSVAYSPDGKTLAGAESMLKEKSNQRAGDTKYTTYVYYGEVLIWDAQTGALKMRLNDNEGPAWALSFSPDGRWLAVGTGPTPENHECNGICPAFGEITLWETGNWKLIGRLRGGSAPIRALAFSPDGGSIAGGAGLIDGGRGASAEDDSNCEIFLWEMGTGKLKQKFPGHTNSVTSLAFSPDGSLLASAGLDRMLKLWDCRSYELKKMASDQMLSIEELQTISEATNPKDAKNAMPPISWINALSFSHDGKVIIGGAGDSIIRFYDSESLKLARVLKPHGWPIFNKLTQSYGERPISMSGNDRAIIGGRRRGINRGMRVMIQGRWPFHPGSLNSMTLSPDGETLAIGNADGKIRLFILK